MVQKYYINTNGVIQHVLYIDPEKKKYMVVAGDYASSSKGLSKDIKSGTYERLFLPPKAEPGYDVLIQTSPTKYLFLSKKIYEFQKEIDRVERFSTYMNAEGVVYSYAVGINRVYLFNESASYPIKDYSRSKNVYYQYQHRYPRDPMKSAEYMALCKNAKHFNLTPL